ncbi:MAG: YbaN family protein [Bacteroidales bacterium]|nr:YbaN family protein [Bacteroidales bacterium]
MKKYLDVGLGCLVVGLGALGVVVPGLPTTPFLLLASWLFYRSSPRLQQWLLASWLGKYIRSYQRRGGMTATQKAGAVGALTVVLFVPNAKNDDI